MSTLRPVPNQSLVPVDDFARASKRGGEGGFDFDEGGGDQAVDWRRYLHAIVHRWWIIVLVTTLVIAAVGAFTVRQPKQYRAAASLIVDVRNQQVLAGVQDIYDATRTSGSLQTELEVMKSRRIAGAAAERLGMHLDDRYNGLAGVTDDAKRRERLAALDPADLTISRYTIEPEKTSNVVRVAVVDEDAAFAAALANAVADVYVEQNIDKRVDGTKDASEWLLVQADELRKKLKSSEESLLTFMSDNGVLNASLESQLDEVKQRLSAFNGALASEEAARIRDVLNVKALEEVRANPELLDTLPEVQSAGVVAGLKTQLMALRTEELSLSSRYLPDHPKLKLIAEQRAVLEADWQREIKALLTSLDRQKASRDAAITGLNVALNEERKKEARLNNLALEYNRLKRERDMDTRLFELVSSRIKEADITGAQPFNTIRILDRALVPKAPFKPNLQQALVAALVAGLVLGVLLAIAIELLDSTVRSQADVEALSGAPFLGLLPIIPVEGGGRAEDRATLLRETRERDLYVLGHPRSAVAECARFIRTNLLFMSPDRPLRSLVVTSPSPQEGKTTSAVTTAISMAQAGSKTLIVDTDLRKPRLHRVFGVDNDQGIANVLLGDVTLDDVIKPTEVPNLFVLPCGTLPPNPSELLLSDRFKELVAELGQRFERVIFDTPPIGPVTDPAILGTLVDGVVLVTKADQTTKDSVKQAVRALNDANARIFGVILNDVDVTAKRYQGAYYAYYRKYGGYYGDDGRRTPPPKPPGDEKAAE